jgi:hypothetical protein
MTANAPTATATTIQIVPFGRCSISTTATVKPAAMSTTAARIVPVRERFAVNAAASRSREEPREAGRHPLDVGLAQRRERDHQRLDVLGPRPPR